MTAPTTSTTSRTRSPLRAAVIGCGGISHEHLAALNQLEGIEIVGVCDASAASAEFARDRYGAGAAFASSSEMIDALSPDVVHVLTPPHTHVDLVVEALDRGCHVVCEKPLTPSQRETDRLLEHARRCGRLLVESQNLRYNDVVLRLDQLLADGRIGVVREVDVSLSLDLAAGPFGDMNLRGPGVRLPGGAVHDFLPHLVYLFLHFASGDVGNVDRIAGFLENRSGNARVGLDSLDALVASNDVRGRLQIVSDVAPDSFRLKVRGDVGSAEVDFYSPFLRLEGGADVGKRAPVEQVRSGLALVLAGGRNLRDKVMRHGTMHGLARMLDDVYDAVDASSPAPISPDAISATARGVDRVLSLAGGAS